jgi:hypothetical protein
MDPLKPKTGRDLPKEPVYNPLSKRNLAESIVQAMLRRKPVPLPPSHQFIGAGIYAIYYTGDFEAYWAIAQQNREGRFERPIYVGKGIPEGGRQGGFGQEMQQTTRLYGRLSEHARSISQASNLNLEDFACRYLAVDDIWIPLAENMLIEKFRPLWNVRVDGFGNHPPGSGRANQKRSAWDTLHPGRSWAIRLPPYPRSVSELTEDVTEYLANPELAEKLAGELLSAEDDSSVV